MDENRTKEQIHSHADAVQRGDFDAVIADFTEELRAQAPQLTQTLPQPVTAASVVNIDFGDEECVALIHYAGNVKEITVRSHWREVDGRPLIFDAEPVE
jgi:hypothetical protein